MAGTFQKQYAEEIARVRRAFFVGAGRQFGRVFDECELDLLAQLDDAEALDHALPALSTRERSELLWALRVSVRTVAPRA